MKSHLFPAQWVGPVGTVMVLTPGKGGVDVDSPKLLKGWGSPKEDRGEETAPSDQCKHGSLMCGSAPANTSKQQAEKTSYPWDMQPKTTRNQYNIPLTWAPWNLLCSKQVSVISALYSLLVADIGKDKFCFSQLKGRKKIKGRKEVGKEILFPSF